MSLIEHSLITTVYNLMTDWGVHCVSCDPCVWLERYYGTIRCYATYFFS